MPASRTPKSSFGTLSALRTSLRLKIILSCPQSQCQCCCGPETSSHRIQLWMFHRHFRARQVVFAMEGSRTGRELKCGIFESIVDRAPFSVQKVNHKSQVSTSLLTSWQVDGTLLAERLLSLAVSRQSRCIRSSLRKSNFLSHSSRQYPPSIAYVYFL